MTLQELYSAKGEIVTTIEVAQAKLQDVNRQIVEILNKPQEPKGVNDNALAMR